MEENDDIAWGRLLYILFMIVTFPLHVSTAHDAAVMVELAKSLHPPGWSDANYCKWDGVSCDSSGRITSIGLASKSLSGQLPPDLNKLSSLKSLSLQRNQISGPLPSLSNLPDLQQVFLDNNNFSSVPPSFLSGLTSLQTLSISENPALPPWTLPESLGDSSTLVTLYASRCSLTGQLPDIFGSFPSLISVRLSYNNLTGPLPASLAKSGVQNLWLNNQNQGFSGRIDVLGSMSELNQVWLHANQFSGPIPDLKNCHSLFDLQLRDNMLTGVIPSSIFSLTKLVNVSLQNNKFQGPIPSFPDGMHATLGTTNSFCRATPGPCDPQVTILLEVIEAIGYPMTLAESWTNNDPCKGWSFISCDSEGSVSVINFGKQGWVGTISPSIAKLKALKNLLLNDNKLTGSIPSSLTTLPQLQLLDVSNNNLSGKVPNFDPRVVLKTSGNPNIGKDLPSGGSSGSPDGDSDSQQNRSSSKTWLIVVLFVVFVILLLASFVIYKRYVNKPSIKYSKRKKSKVNDARINSKGYGGFGSKVTSHGNGESGNIQLYDGGNVTIPIEILREVTNNFSEDHIIGRGGFGVVYRGRLHDGTEIAVKRMEAAVASTKGLNEFKAEIEVLTKVRHKNLVALHGFCINGIERLLVYEYMPSGTLGQHLFNWKEMGVSPLSWKQRVSIALDVARGVEYLHTLAKQSFIHRDLKPSNILLDEDMRAKVSDFGLVKSTPEGKVSIETRLAGTFGYLAPEYASTGKVTTKVDVFAFGVVLMEMTTGRKALDDNVPEDQSHLVTWFRKIIVNKDDIREYIDPSLDRDEETFNSILKVAELAGHCTARELANRPDMGHVVNVLSPLIDKWKPKNSEEDTGFGIDLNMSLPHLLQRWQSESGESSYTMSGELHNTNSQKFSSKGSR